MVTPARPGPLAQTPKKGCWKPIRNTLLIGLLLFAGAILWGWMLGSAEDKARAWHALSTRPYLALLRQGSWQEAWSTYTTPAYRAAYPFEVWKAAQQARQFTPMERIGEPGSLSARLIPGGVSVKYYDLVEMPAGQSAPVIFYELQDTPDGPRIDATYRLYHKEFRTQSGERRGEAAYAAEPW